MIGGVNPALRGAKRLLLSKEGLARVATGAVVGGVGGAIGVGLARNVGAIARVVGAIGNGATTNVAHTVLTADVESKFTGENDLTSGDVIQAAAVGAIGGFFGGAASGATGLAAEAGVQLGEAAGFANGMRKYQMQKQIDDFLKNDPNSDAPKSGESPDSELSLATECVPPRECN